jgi:hypothetical protein
MPITLSADERDVLLDVLRTQLGDLKAEINRTETTAFRDELKGREAALASIIAKLEADA